MSSWILEIDTDSDCWLNFINPVNNEENKLRSRIRAEFNGATHLTKLFSFLDTLEVVDRPDKEGCAVELKRYLKQLRRVKSEDFRKGGNITVSYKKLVVEFSI
jgi:hypothetical protein